ITGVVALALYFLSGRNVGVLAVMSAGYGALQDAMSHETALSVGMLLAIAFGKVVTTSATIGSGGSGGVFGPSIVIGGCGGAAVGVLLHRLSPALFPHPASFAVVGMAGFFAAAAKTPFSTLVIVSEMTGSYRLLLPALWVCVLAFLLSDRESIYHSQLESRARSPAHKGSYVRQLLADVRVRRFVGSRLPLVAVKAADSLQTVVERLSDCGLPVLPVVDAEGRLLGVIDVQNTHIATQGPHAAGLIIAADLMRTDVVPLTPDDALDQAQELFVDNDLLALPLVDDLKNRRVLAMIRRHDIASAYLQHVHGRQPSIPGDTTPPPPV
ncbi:MAG: chloride channel protein, partial [Polyangiaceae bacterium]